MTKKRPEDELKDAARRGKVKRPSRSYCQACKVECGSPLLLLVHIRKVHS
jgi:hypothetical protein